MITRFNSKQTSLRCLRTVCCFSSSPIIMVYHHFVVVVFYLLVAATTNIDWESVQTAAWQKGTIPWLWKWPPWFMSVPSRPAAVHQERNAPFFWPSQWPALYGNGFLAAVPQDRAGPETLVSTASACGAWWLPLLLWVCSWDGTPHENEVCA